MSDVTTALDRALHHHQRGDFAQARADGEAALADRPDDPALLRLLGDSCCRSGDLGKGVEYLRRAHEIAPGDTRVRFDLASALAATGDLVAAEAILGVDRAQSHDADLLRLRGYILQAQGRHAEAIDAYGDAVALYPDDWETWNNLGNTLRAAGDRETAVDALTRAARLRPDMATVQLNLGAALVEAGRLKESVGAYEAAARLAPDHAAIQFELGRLLRHLGRDADALAPLARAAELALAHLEAQLESARTLVSLARFDEAEAAYLRTIGAHPQAVAAYLELGIVLERGNRLDALAELLRQADAEGVTSEALTYLRAVALRREGKLEEALALAKTVPAGVEPVRRARLIGRLADALDDTQTAFAAFEEMNRLTLRAHPDARLRAAQYRRQVASIADMVDERWYASWRAAEPSRSRPAPVFLVGFPRSGTTLLDTLLMGHPDVRVLEEVPLLEQVKTALGDFSRLPSLETAAVDRLRALYFSELDKHVPAGDGLVVDKLPLNLVGAPLIHRIFPDARFIFAQRHPCDAVLSCFMQDFQVNEAMASFLDLGDAAGLYDGVMGLWDRCTRVFPLSVHNVRYEGIVEKVEPEMRSLLTFLDLPWDDRILDHQETAAGRGRILAPSYDQVTEGIYSGASGRWERYRHSIEGILPVLQPWAESMGYRI